MANKLSLVVAGDYKGYLLNTFRNAGYVSAYLCPPGFKGLKKTAHIDLNSETVKEINEKINNIDRKVGKSFAKELMFGISAATAKQAKITLEIVFNDGKKCLIQTNNKDYENLMIACYK